MLYVSYSGSSWHNGSSALGIVDLFNDNIKHGRQLDVLWKHYLEIGGDSILARPNFQHPGRTSIVYHEPVFDASTASYHDMSLSLQRIKQKQVVEKRLTFVMVVGDQQTYKRMVDLKREQPSEYHWLVPMPGEFHFRVHTDFAITDLLWASLLSNLVGRLRFEKTIAYRTANVELSDHYDIFLQLVTKAASLYLEEIVPAHLLINPQMLLEAVFENKGNKSNGLNI